MRYRTIVADPPWPMPESGRRTGAGTKTWGRDSHAPTVKLPYKTMRLAQILSLPVSDLADDDAHLYLWTTNRFLEAAYEVARAWDFRPAQMLTWCKPPMGLGMGGAFVATTEFCLFARRGSLKALSRQDSTWWAWGRVYGTHILHSAKPEAFLDMVERVSPSPRLEMFARRNRLGWDTWGNESLEHVSLSTSPNPKEPRC